MSCDRDGLELRMQALCSWLKCHSEQFPEDHALRQRRINGFSLADAGFLGEIMHSFDPEALPMVEDPSSGLQEPPNPMAVADCLSSAVIQQNMNEAIEASDIVHRALSTEDLEPLDDIIRLWQFVLVYAILYCADERKARHIELMENMPANLQAPLVSMITDVQQEIDSYDCNEHQERAASTPSRDDHDSALQLSANLSGSDLQVTPPRDSLLDESLTGEVPAALPNRKSVNRKSVAPVVAGLEAEECQAIVEQYAQANADLQKKNANLQKRVEHGENARRRTLVAESKVLDSEFETMEEAWQLKKDLDETTEQLKEAREAAEEGRKAMAEMINLRDQVAFLQSQTEDYHALQQKMEKCQEKLEKAGNLKQRLQETQSQLATAMKDKDDIAKEWNLTKQAETQLAGWRRKTENLERQCLEADSKYRRLEQELCEAQKEQERLNGVNQQLNTRVQDLQQREKDLMSQVSEGPRQREVVEELFTDELKEKMRALESRNEVLEHQLTVEGRERQAELSIENQILASSKTHFEKKTHELEAELAQTQRTVKILEGESQDLREKLSAAGDDKESMETELAEERDALRETKAEKAQLQGHLETAQRECRRIKEELQHREADLKQARAAHATKSKELDGLRQESSANVKDVENAERHREMLEKDIKKYKEQCRQLPDVERQLKLLRTKKSDLEGEVAKWSGMYEQTRKDLESHQGELKSLREENAGMKKQLRFTKFQVGEQDKLQKNCGLESLEREHNDLAARYDEIVSGLKKEKQLSQSLRQDLEYSEAKWKKLEAAMERACPAELSAVDRDVALQRIEELPNQLKAKIRELEAQLGDHRIRLAEETKQHAECRAQLRDTSQTALAAQQELKMIDDGAPENASIGETSKPAKPSTEPKSTVPVAKSLGPQAVAKSRGPQATKRPPPSQLQSSTSSSTKLVSSTEGKMPEKTRGILKKSKENDVHVADSPAKVQRRGNTQPWSAADPNSRAPARRMAGDKRDQEQCAQQ